MQNWVLFIYFLVGFIGVYIYYKKDIIYPTVIFFGAYTLSSLCALYNSYQWNTTISWKTVILLVAGSFVFLAVSLIIDFIYKKKNAEFDDKKIEKYKYNIYKIEKWKIIVITVYSILSISLLFYYVYKIAYQFGDNFNSFKEVLNVYRNNTAYNANASLPKFMSILMKINFASCYISMFIFVNNINFDEQKMKEKIKKYAFLLIPVLTYFIQSFVSSNRLAMVTTIIAFVIMEIITWYRKENWNKTISIKNLILLGVTGIITLLLFYYSATLVGRKIGRKPLDYLTMYIGGSIECLDLYLDEPTSKSGVIGYETFYGLVKNVHDYLKIDVGKVPTGQLEWRYINDNKVMVGNVYTAYRRWIQDFGYIGAVILQVIMATIYICFYKYIKKCEASNEKNNLLLILYSYFAYSLCTHPIDSTFYSFTFRIFFIVQVIILIGMYYFLINMDLKKIIGKWKNEKINN